PHPEEPREARRLEGWTAMETVAVLRDARKSALLRTRLKVYLACEGSKGAGSLPESAAPARCGRHGRASGRRPPSSHPCCGAARARISRRLAAPPARGPAPCSRR